MNIIGENVVLRAIEPADSALLLELINDPVTEHMLGGSSFPVSHEMQVNWISELKQEQTTLRCIIELKNENRAIGTVILSDIDYKNGNAEVHIKILNKGLRGKGYGFDTITTIVKYAFSELRLNCIFARVVAYNEPSLKLFAKCGFSKEGTLRKRVFKQGQFQDVIILSIIKE